MRLPFRKCISRESGSIKTNADVNLTSLALANVRYSRQVQLQTETRSQDRKQSKKIRKLKKCIGSAADVRSHTSCNNKNCMYFAFCEHHCIGQQRIIVVPKLATESSKSWWLNVTKLCYAPKRCKNLITKASKGPIFSKAPPSAKFQLPHHCPCIPL